MTHIWMEHDVTHLRAALPDIPYWRASGWEPCDGPPPEPDLSRDANTTRPDGGFFDAQEQETEPAVERPENEES